MTLEVLWTLWLILYFGLFLRFTNGFTPGKRLMGVRVVSLTHDRLSFWQSVERGLGYGGRAWYLSGIPSHIGVSQSDVN